MEHISFWGKIRTILLLVFYFFSFFMLFVAPIELYAVYRVRSWEPVRAQFIAAYTEQIRWHGLNEVVRYEFRDLDTGKIIHTSDVRPGDLPFNLNVLNTWTWSTDRADIEKYQSKPIVTVYRAPNGEDYFVEQGSYNFMGCVFVVCLVCWGWVLTHLKPSQPNAAALKQARARLVGIISSHFRVNTNNK